jgi:hypothetical protein
VKIDNTPPAVPGDLLPANVAVRDYVLESITTVYQRFGYQRIETLSELTGIGQGRLSEWVRHKRTPTASSTFEAFADGLAIPPRAQQALGLARVPVGSPGPGIERSPGGRAAQPAQAPSGTARPPATGLSGLHGLEGCGASSTL